MQQEKTTTPSYYQDFYTRDHYYVKLAVVADHSMFLKYNENGTKVLERIRAVIHHLNKVYEPLNLHAMVIWTDIWTDRDAITVDVDGGKTIKNFLHYLENATNNIKRSHATLLTNVLYEDGVSIGIMDKHCEDLSVSTIVDQDPNPKGVAIALAHELGHSFGVSHDLGDCLCPFMGRCIMTTTAIHGPITDIWSKCSLSVLRKMLDKNFFPCLKEKPPIADDFPRCGNGALEEGEECDCGSKFSCQNKCCDPLTCKLTKNAKCAAGGCCDLNTCLPKPISTLCRNVTNVCDLPEYCDGKSFQCPDDFYIQDGLRCTENSNAFCYSGVCGSRDEKCKKFFDQGARSEALCYDLNVRGNIIGNCGYNARTNKSVPCGIKDYSCGRLYCGDVSKYQKTLRYYTHIYINRRTFYENSKIGCNLLIPIYEDLDETLVGDGAVCSENMICVHQKCKNRTKEMMLLPQCKPRNCNNVGTCNNVGNCHCKIGYGGTDCAVSGPGGSVNSGPASVYHPNNLSRNQYGMKSWPLFETNSLLWFLTCLYIISIVLICFIERKKLGSFLNGTSKRKAPKFQLSGISRMEEDIDIVSLHSLKSAMESSSGKSKYSIEANDSFFELSFYDGHSENPKIEMSPLSPHMSQKS